MSSLEYMIDDYEDPDDPRIYPSDDEEEEKFTCLFPEKCLMPGDHLSDECHTAAMVEAIEAGYDVLTADCNGNPVIYTEEQRDRDKGRDLISNYTWPVPEEECPF